MPVLPASFACQPANPPARMASQPAITVGVFDLGVIDMVFGAFDLGEFDMYLSVRAKPIINTTD